MKLFRMTIPVLMLCALPLFISGCQKSGEKEEGLPEKTAETSGDVKDHTAEIKSEIRQNLSETAEAVKEGTSAALGKVKEGASETAKSIKEGAVEVKEEIKEKSLEAVEAVTEKTAETAKELKEKIAPPSVADYVGAKKCKTCHIKQYKSWSDTAMSSSFENLKPGVRIDAKKMAGMDPGKDYTDDPECVRCHVTGYGNGGFVSMEKTPDLAGVQCEACHGPGSEYSVLMKKNKQFALKEAKDAGLVIPSEDEEGCLRCHGGDSPFNETLDPRYRFDFKERLKKTHTHFPLRYKH